MPPVRNLLMALYDNITKHPCSVFLYLFHYETNQEVERRERHSESRWQLFLSHLQLEHERAVAHDSVAAWKLLIKCRAFLFLISSAECEWQDCIECLCACTHVCKCVTVTASVHTAFKWACVVCDWRLYSGLECVNLILFKKKKKSNKKPSTATPMH